ncbi:hypothetical protein GHT06_012870 [Daphnia sinensis]|uniref:Uncharacterized protein n=1 Tax=Daphnia sinensis TaxID=1820382 RepID=A0AAD5LGP5_9CRUS|nr:hypothetical protein GHT06_012870 [Daphnia sinensis]
MGLGRTYITSVVLVRTDSSFPGFVMEPAQHDLLEIFTNSGLPEIAEDGKIWKRCLEKMLYKPTLWNIYRRCDALPSKPHPMDVEFRDQKFFKMACHTVTRYHQRLLYNWMTGAQQEDSQEIEVYGTTVSFDMNPRYLVIGQLDGTILVRMREDVALEPQNHEIQELKLVGPQSGIRCLRLNEENILVCGGAQGVVQIWDVSMGKLLQRFTDKRAGNIEHVQFDNKLVLTGSSIQETEQSRVTIWDVGNLPKISLEGEIVFPLQKIFGLALDDKYIVVLVGQAPLFEIQVRPRHDFLVILHSMHYRSHAFSGFHCHLGFVAAGSDDGKIRIWDVGTGKCKRVLLRPSHDTGPFWLRFNSKFLVTNNSRGIGIWNFKEAVNPYIHPCMKLHCCSFRACSSSQSDQWHFQMDAFEIVRFQHQLDAGMLPDLPAMASQPPVQYNLMSPSIPNVTGTSQPPTFQRPTASNGIGQPSAGSRFPMPATSNSVPVLANTNSQWARPPVSSQFAPSPMSQPSFTAGGQQLCNPAISGQNSPRPVLENLSSGRPPSSSSGPPLNNYQSGQPNINGNLGPPLANGVRTPTAYSSVNYAAPASSSMGYSSPVGPPQYASQNFMPPQLHSGSGPPMGRPAGPPVPQQQYNTGYPSYSSASGQLPPTSGIHTQQLNYPAAPVLPNAPVNQFQNFNSTIDKMASQMNTMSVTQTGFDKIWGHENVDLLQVRNILPAQGVETPRIRLRQEHLNNVHCSMDIFRCTLTKIPETNSILQKSRLPLGVLIHPFKDLTQLPVIQCQTIVRCRSCRTYINPFVYFVDQRRWKCNLCFRVNDLPDEFQYDPMSNSYGDPTRRPEIKNATIEFIAPAEYMLRPPQPPVYLYLLDVSHVAVETGYLKLFCDVLLEELEKIPGDSRTQIGFITFASSVQFYNLAENLNQPHQLVVSDIEDIFLPCPNDLLVNLNESKRLVIELLEQLPLRFNNTADCNSALGAALQAAYKMVSPTGGRITVFQASLPNIGPGALKPREDPNQRAAKDVPNLNAATDFYKKFALDCSGQQVAVDLFLLGGQYMDIASLSCASKFSGGCMYHFPSFHYVHNLPQVERLEHSLRRYLTRKIGFESVMRIRCTHGLSIHTFHGNFFVRSTDLLSLPNINPDAGFGLQVSIDENLSEVQNICFQAALLYTSSKGERRIRVHTMCLPIASTVADVIQSADQQCIVGLLAKMAVDRSLHSSISDARDAIVNVCVDVLSAYKATLSSATSGLYAPSNLRLLPLYLAALLKSVAFRTGQSTRLDDRVFAMNQLKVLPLSQLILSVYPDMYAIHNLHDQVNQRNSACHQGEMVIPQPPRLHLSAEMVDSSGAYLLDTGDVIYLYVGRNVHPAFIENVLGSSNFQSLPEQMFELPELETAESERLRNFLIHLQNQRPYPAVLQLIREDSQIRHLFSSHLVDGRTESSLSYYEFLQHLKNQIK